MVIALSLSGGTGAWVLNGIGDMEYRMDVAEAERLITHRFGLEDLKCGLDIMRDKTENYTKIMIKVCGEGGL